MSIYTVFVLADPRSPDVIRFVGLTSQIVTKRVADIVAAAVRPGFRAHSTALSTWIRELGNPPKISILYNSESRYEAAEQYRIHRNLLIRTGMLLNTRAGKIAGRKWVEETHEDIGGRPVEETSANALKNARIKEQRLKKLKS